MKRAWCGLREHAIPGRIARSTWSILRILLILFAGSVMAAAQARAPYLNPSLPVDQRVRDLVSRMTLEEKIGQMMDRAPAIDRLGIPAYDWWNEALHGVARAGVATVFPQAIGLAATWDDVLLEDVADVISTEARAKYNDAIRRGRRERYYGITFWSPNINLFRDPRWGRGQETYGEDPFLTSRMGVAFVRGLQGSDPKYLKVVATPKHFAVHSGPEPLRHKFDVPVSPHDLEDTYLPAFRATITEAHAASVMCAYNAVDGKPACASDMLLGEHLRGQWKFDGYVVSDCGAVGDIQEGHRFTATAPQAAAVAVKTGTDLDCGDEYRALPEAVSDVLITESDINTAVTRLFTARFRLGMFDPPASVPFNSIPISANDTAQHRELALRAARESIVLLKNNGILPFKQHYRRIAVIGPNADSLDVLLGNYNGTPSRYVTVLEGIRQRFRDTQVLYAPGPPLTGVAPQQQHTALDNAKTADVIVLVLGISPRLEGEEMDVQVEGFSGGDRTSLDLPRGQEELLEAMAALRKPVVVVLLSGSALAVNWATEHADAILEAWYPGEEGGTAVAETLAGDNNPAGRLPVTFYKSAADLPPFIDYSMQGRTYRYFRGQPLYAFGHGLSYSQFRYSNAVIRKAAQGGAELQVEVENVSGRSGDEVIQVYLDAAKGSPAAAVFLPIRSLIAFRRIPLRAHEKRTVVIPIAQAELTAVDQNGKRVELHEGLHLDVGGGQPGYATTVGLDFNFPPK